MSATHSLASKLTTTVEAARRACAMFIIQWGLTPNQLTVAGLLLTLLAAGMLVAGELLFAVAILTMGSVLDALDGALARASNNSSSFGAFLDSICDRAGEAAIFIALVAYGLFAGELLLIWGAVAAWASSSLVSYTRARAEGLYLQADAGPASRAPRIVLLLIGLFLAGIGLHWGLILSLWSIALLAALTVGRRIWQAGHSIQPT